MIGDQHAVAALIGEAGLLDIVSDPAGGGNLRLSVIPGAVADGEIGIRGLLAGLRWRCGWRRQASSRYR